MKNPFKVKVYREHVTGYENNAYNVVVANHFFSIGRQTVPKEMMDNDEFQRGRSNRYFISYNVPNFCERFEKTTFFDEKPWEYLWMIPMYGFIRYCVYSIASIIALILATPIFVLASPIGTIWDDIQKNWFGVSYFLMTLSIYLTGLGFIIYKLYNLFA